MIKQTRELICRTLFEESKCQTWQHSSEWPVCSTLFQFALPDSNTFSFHNEQSVKLQFALPVSRFPAAFQFPVAAVQNLQTASCKLAFKIANCIHKNLVNSKLHSKYIQMSPNISKHKSPNLKHHKILDTITTPFFIVLKSWTPQNISN